MTSLTESFLQRKMKPFKKYMILLWIYFAYQVSRVKCKNTTYQNITDRTLSLNVNLQHSTDESSSTVLAIDPIKSFLLWTIFEAIALGFITTAAIGSMHSSYPTKYPPHFYPITYPPYTHFYDNFNEISRKFRRNYNNIPTVTDILWPSDTDIYFSLVPSNSTEPLKPCKNNDEQKTDTNPP